MPDYDVTIQATVTKTIRVEGAANVQAAIEEAHQIFTVEADEDVPHEKYEEQCLDCKEVK